jgi:dTDP-4-dehydrorhamnose 3,5-epimerase
MEFIERKLKGVFEITPGPFFDERGFFMRTFDVDVYKENGISSEWVQENHSRTEKRGIIRGLHFQVPPFSESKLVRCIRGEVFDVFVDLRPGSHTFGQWDFINLSEENKKLVLIPRGFAHGFCTLSDISEVMYKVDNFYSREHERGIIWNDPDLAITWPVRDPVLSAKDKSNMFLKQYISQVTMTDKESAS